MPNLNYYAHFFGTHDEITNPMDIQIVNIIKKNNKINTEKIAIILGVSSKTVKRHIKNIGIIRFVGRGSNGYWEIIDDNH